MNSNSIVYYGSRSVILFIIFKLFQMSCDCVIIQNVVHATQTCSQFSIKIYFVYTDNKHAEAVFISLLVCCHYRSFFLKLNCVYSSSTWYGWAQATFLFVLFIHSPC